MSGTGYPPYDWRIDEIERLARNAAPSHEVASLRGDVDRLERSLRESSAEIAGLRAQLETMQNALIEYSRPTDSGREEKQYRAAPWTNGQEVDSGREG